MLADVVCRQAGFDGGYAEWGGAFGPGFEWQPIWMSRYEQLTKIYCHNVCFKQAPSVARDVTKADVNFMQVAIVARYTGCKTKFKLK